jgi:peroxidase
VQRSEEVDLKMVSAVRTIMFGPPGAGGTDLAAVDIQRGRDHGLPDYNTLRESYGLPRLTSFNQITSDPTVRQALATIYSNDIDNIDSFVGGLAEDHVAGSSLGPLFREILRGQFQRLRDADRLFYRSNLAGLYTNGVLNASIASLVNLNTVTLAEIVKANADAATLGGNVFYASIPGDFNHDGYVDQGDLTMWRSAVTTGTMTGADLLVWQRNLGSEAPWVAAAAANAMAIPEPTSITVALLAATTLLARRRRR